MYSSRSQQADIGIPAFLARWQGIDEPGRLPAGIHAVGATEKYLRLESSISAKSLTLSIVAISNVASLKMKSTMGSSRRSLSPEYEHDLIRDPRLGYEPTGTSEFVRCVEHGSPTPLERWHCHDEYELQLIIGARGHAFVGDYVGHFEPGHLVLTGPGLPHNWISTDLPPSGLAVRSLVIQFRREPLLDGMHAIKELEETRPLLERARLGVEFFGLSESVRDRFYRIKQSHGLERFAEFIGLLCLLRRCEDYRMLSSDPIVGLGLSDARLKTIVEFVNENYAESISIAEVAARFNMSEGSFSRYFSKATNSTFVGFLNRVRIHKACELLMNSESQVSTICYEVGFNNVANFNRRFLDIKGMTPSEFRRQSTERFGSGKARGEAAGTGIDL